MIDPSFDSTAPTMESVEDFLTRNELEAKVADLENKLSLKTQQWEYAGEQVRKYAAQVDSFESALKYNEWDFDFDTLADLASYFDLTLEKEYDVTITVRWSGTVSAPMDYDMEDIENVLDISLDTGYGGAALTVDMYQDDFDIDYTEA